MSTRASRQERRHYVRHELACDNRHTADAEAGLGTAVAGGLEAGHGRLGRMLDGEPVPDRRGLPAVE